MVIFIADITNGFEPTKISFLNELNNQEICYVDYSADCVLSSDSLIGEYESVPLPCECEGNICSTSNCSCVFNNARKTTNAIPMYSEESNKPIIECSDLCKCDDRCSNRVVQQGIKFLLQVFMTADKGFGVRNLEYIPKSSFVCEYAGEIIDVQEAEKRLKSQKFDSSNYIYVLKEFGSEGHCTRTIIDPTSIGNVGRYLNHSCSPNLIPIPVRSNSMIPRICFFSNCDIEPLQELTYNYGGKSIGYLNDKSSARRCLCKSEECQQFLPFDENVLEI